MTPLSHRLRVCLPALATLLLILLSATPLTVTGVSLVPNIAWLATIAFARIPNIPWPAWLAFAFGLLQDVVFATPLGAQAIVALVLLLAIRARPPRVGQPLLRDSWVEAAVLLAAAQLAFILMLQWVLASPPPMLPILLSAVINILWFPAISWGTGRLAMAVAK